MIGAGRRWRCALAAALVVGLLGTAARAADEADLALAVLQEARELAARGALEPALEKTERALAFARAEHGPYDALVGFILDELASLNYRLGRLDTALEHAREALPVIRAARGPASLGHALIAGNLASILSALGRDQEALPLLEEALPLVRSGLGRGNVRTAAIAQNLGMVQARLDRTEEARASFDMAVDAWETIGGTSDPRMLRALLGRAEVALDADDLDAARTDAERAVGILAGVETPPPADLTAASMLLAETDLRAGRPDDALTRLEAAAERMRALDADHGPASRRLLDRLATLYLLHREFRRAEVLLTTLEEGRDAVARADRLARLAEARIGLGRLEEAERDLLAAVDLLEGETAPPPELLAAVRRDLAGLDLEAGRAAEAVKRLESMLPAEDPQPGWTRALLGHARLRLGEPAAARAAFAAAMDAGSAGCPDPATLHLALADLDLADGDFPGAKERLETALEEPAAQSAAVRVALADLRLADGRSDDALDLIRAAVAGLDVDTLTGDCSLQTGPAASREEVRRLLERALEVAAAATARARTAPDLALMLEIAERTLALDGRAVREAMVAALAAGDGPAAALLEERMRLERAIAGRRSLLIRHRLAPVIAAEQRGAVRDQVLRLERQRDDVRQGFRLEAGSPLVMIDPPAVALADLQSRLGEDEAVLVQVTTERLTHLFLVRRGSVAFAQTEVSTVDLAAWVDAARREILGDDGFDSFPLHALHAGLVAPFAAGLGEIDHLLVLPDGAMRGLPFGLLVEAPAEPVPAGGDFAPLDFLAERLAISRVPDLAGVGGGIAPSSADLPLLGLAAPLSWDEPVPDEERERWLRALAQGVADDSDDVVLDLQARKTTLTALDVARFKVVALAMPLLPLPEAEAASLSGDAGDERDLITAADIARLQLDADMVVLRPGAGDGPALAPAFLVAGARSVVMGHWAAPPEAAAMVGRGAEMLRERPDLRPAEALRRAALSMIAGEDGPAAAHPKTWGSFSLLSGG